MILAITNVKMAIPFILRNFTFLNLLVDFCLMDGLVQGTCTSSSGQISSHFNAIFREILPNNWLAQNLQCWVGPSENLNLFLQ